MNAIALKWTTCRNPNRMSIPEGVLFSRPWICAKLSVALQQSGTEPIAVLEMIIAACQVDYEWASAPAIHEAAVPVGVLVPELNHGSDSPRPTRHVFRAAHSAANGVVFIAAELDVAGTRALLWLAEHALPEGARSKAGIEQKPSSYPSHGEDFVASERAVEVGGDGFHGLCVQLKNCVQALVVDPRHIPTRTAIAVSKPVSEQRTAHDKKAKRGDNQGRFHRLSLFLCAHILMRIDATTPPSDEVACEVKAEEFGKPEPIEVFHLRPLAFELLVNAVALGKDGRDGNTNQRRLIVSAKSDAVMGLHIVRWRASNDGFPRGTQNCCVNSFVAHMVAP